MIATNRSPRGESDNDRDGYPGCDDCNDLEITVYPEAIELCDGLDNNCDDSLGLGEVDNDGDGVFICQADCNDNDMTVYPGAVERCDEQDNDCDQATSDPEDCPQDCSCNGQTEVGFKAIRSWFLVLFALVLFGRGRRPMREAT